MPARDELILDLEREIEHLLGFPVLRELQMRIDEIIQRVDSVFRRAAIGFRDFSGVVRFDRVEGIPPLKGRIL